VNARILNYPGVDSLEHKLYNSFISAIYILVPSMDNGPELLSPKQVARAIGVSESSLKRWCDKGVVKTVRTAGGHRKIAIAEVVRFIRDNGHPLVSPEILGLPPVSKHSSTGLEQGAARLVEALLAGDELLARQIVFDLYLAKHRRSVIFDEVMATAFHQIGDRWACHEAEVYQERRGCEISLRILFDLRRVQQIPERTWLATGGTIEGDQYLLPSTMAELVLRDCGFFAVSLGASIPFDSLVKAVRQTKPHLFWLSVSHIHEGLDFLTEFAALSRTCMEMGTALAVGGRALTEELRHHMTYSAYCDNMQHLEAFATTLHRSLTGTQNTEQSSSPTKLIRQLNQAGQ
jgi:methanogenic corrinoid protein MtbC1